VKVLLALILTLLVVAAPASAKHIRRDNSSSRTLRLWPNPQPIKNWRFFRAIGRCEQPAPAGAQRKDGTWPKRYMWGIDWHHQGASYPGGLGVWAPLWREKGIAGTDMAPSPEKATPREQMIQAQRIVRRYGLYAWGCAGVALARTS
jgi:hypothetical protein